MYGRVTSIFSLHNGIYYVGVMILVKVYIFYELGENYYHAIVQRLLLELIRPVLEENLKTGTFFWNPYFSIQEIKTGIGTFQ